MTNFTTPPIADFDPAGRGPKYTTVLVQANGVDPNTGINTPSVDQTTPLVFSYNQGAASGSGGTPAVLVDQVAIAANGARVIRWRPGVLQPAASAQPWSVRISVPNTVNFVTQGGTTPPPPEFSGVAPGAAESDTQPA